MSNQSCPKTRFTCIGVRESPQQVGDHVYRYLPLPWFPVSFTVESHCPSCATATNTKCHPNPANRPPSQTSPQSLSQNTYQTSLLPAEELKHRPASTTAFFYAVFSASIGINIWSREAILIPSTAKRSATAMSVVPRIQQSVGQEQQTRLIQPSST